MNNQFPMKLPFIPELKIIAEQNDYALRQLFKGKIKSHFLITMKERIMKELGLENFIKYYDFRWTNESMVIGMEGSAEYDICRMIVGIHSAHSIFLSDEEVRKNEKNERYRQQIITETIEKIKLRPYGSIYFRKKTLLFGEEFLYYPLLYELFVMCISMGQMMKDNIGIDNMQFYYGIMYNGVSALSLVEDNLMGSAYPLCRGAIEMYLKLLIFNTQPELYKWYEKFRKFEVIQSCCTRKYPEEFNIMFRKRICYNSKNKIDYLHFGWVDFIDGYHELIKKYPYSINGIFAFLKKRDGERNLELELLESLYKSCHAYTHGSVQTANYPILHYFEISIMLYYIVRGTFLLLCEEKGEKAVINDVDIISITDRDFKMLYEQYGNRSTENFEKNKRK